MDDLADPLWGPARPCAPTGGHRVGNAACEALARGSRLEFAGGRIDALVLCDGEILRTAAPAATHYGVAQVRRLIRSKELRMVHLVFAPFRSRPLLLGLARIENQSERLLSVRYTELWDVRGEDIHEAEGACVCQTAAGPRALADASAAIRGRAPQPLPRVGLALDMTFALPAGARRQLAFAYAAPQPGDNPAALVRAWRGDVAAELQRTVKAWLARTDRGEDPLEAYRGKLDAAG